MKNFKFLVILIFLFALILRTGFFSQKEDLFFDEILNMTASNHNEFYVNRNNYVQDEKPFTGTELQKKFLLDDSSLKDVLNDIKNMHKTSGDVLHTNFYYSLFRIFFAGTDNYNIHQYVVRAGLLNLILFSFSFFFMYKLLNELFEEKKFVLIGLFFAFCNPASVCNTLYFREYQLQEMFMVLLAYAGIYFYRNMESYKSALILSAISSFALLSGYYIGVFVFFLYLILLNKKSFKYLLFSAFYTLLFVLILYPDYFGFFMSKFIHSKAMIIKDAAVTSASSADSAVQSVGGNEFLKAVFYNFIDAPLIIYRFACSYALMIYFVILTFFVRKFNKPVFVITFLSVLWAVIIFTTAPYKIARYMLPVIPLCTIILTWVLSCLNSKKLITIACCLFSLHLGFVTYNTLNDTGEIQVTANKKNIKTFLFEKNPDLPVYINLSDKEKVAYFATHLKPEQKYIFVNNNSDILDKHFYFIFGTDNSVKFNENEIKELNKISQHRVFEAEVTK